MMKAAVTGLCLVAVAYAMPSSSETERAPFRLRYDPYEVTWTQFKLEHGKMYENDEQEKQRRQIFINNVKYIEKHNWEYFNEQKSSYLAVNQFSDLTVEEFQQYNKLQTQKADEIQCSKFMPPLNWVLPASVDWRKKGYVTPVKNQGECGSCWAFSATGSLEGQHFRKTGKLISLSEQQLVDCSNKYGNNGCGGGFMDYAFQYVNAVGGIESEKEYPYKAVDQDCTFVKSEEVADLSGCKDIPAGSELSLEQAVASVGPVSVAIDASNQAFMSYSGGVYDEPDCSSTQLDHGVLVVGYGTFKGKEYWLVKNSWGTKWGMDGYIMMSRNKNNQCGIATLASYPVV